MGRHAKTQGILDTAVAILKEHRPMTVRQVYYQLVSRQVIKNNDGRYKAVSKLLVEARRSGDIPWEWIEDRLRQPRTVNMWTDLGEFAETLVAAATNLSKSAVLVHADIGSRDQNQTDRTRAIVASSILSLMQPKGLVIADRPILNPDLAAIELPRCVPPGRYYMYRGS